MKKLYAIIICLVAAASVTAQGRAARVDIDLSSLPGMLQFIDRIVRPCSSGTVPLASVIVNPNNTGNVNVTPCQGKALTVNGIAVVTNGLPDPGANGYVVRTAANTTVARTFTASTPLTISNGSGVAGATDYACATCTTNAAALTANRLVIGGGSQAATVLGSLGTTTTVLHGNAAGAPTFGAVANADLTNSSITIQGSAVALGGSTLATTSTPQFARLGLNQAVSATQALVATATSGTLIASFTGTAGQNSTVNFTSDTAKNISFQLTIGAQPKWYVLASGATDALQFTAADSIGNPVLFSIVNTVAGPITFGGTNYTTCTALTTAANVVTCTVSSAKVKQGFQLFNDGLSVVRKLQPQTFQFRKGTDYYDGGKTHLGLIAENMRAASPLLVSPFTHNSEALLQPEPMALHALEINAIKQLDARITRLEKENQRLRKLLAKRKR